MLKSTPKNKKLPYILLILFSVCVLPVVQAETIFDFDLPTDDDGIYPYSFIHKAMGTEFVFDIYPREGDVGYDDMAPIALEAFQLVDSLEQEISSWIASSDTSQINEFAAETPVPVRKTVFELLQFSAQIHKDTGGVFDITVGPLIGLWKKPLAEGTEPSPTALAEVLTRVDMNKVSLDTEKQRVSFGTKGMRISFGGIGKGLALDIAAEYLKSQGVTSALLSGGDSSMVCIGVPPGKEFWNIGIHNPYNEDDSLETVHLRDQALSTSACYHHLAGVTEQPCGIFDPRTGQTATGIISATVVAQSGMQTDALSTSFYVMGVDETREYCKRHLEVSAVLVANPVQGTEPHPIHINRQK